MNGHILSHRRNIPSHTLPVCYKPLLLTEAPAVNESFHKSKRAWEEVQRCTELAFILQEFADRHCSATPLFKPGELVCLYTIDFHPSRSGQVSLFKPVILGPSFCNHSKGHLSHRRQLQ